MVEDKRLGRTLPAVINGLSASQAQAQGLLEELSDVEDGSLAKSESLFVDGSSDDEGSQSGARSESPQNNIDVNGDTPNLKTAATVSGSFATPAYSISSGLKSVERTSTFGKPTPIFSPNPFQKPAGPFGVSSSTTFPQFNSAAGIDFNSKATTSPKPETLGGSAVLGFDFSAAAAKQKGRESHIAFNTPDNRETPDYNPFPLSVQDRGNDNDPKRSQSALSIHSQRGTFGQPSALFPMSTATGSAPTPSPALTTQPTQTVSGSNQHSKSTTPLKYTFATSPLFNFPAKIPDDSSNQSTNESALDGSDGKATDTTALPEDNPKPVQSPFPNDMNGATSTQLSAPAISGGLADLRNDSLSHLSPFSNVTAASVTTPKPLATSTGAPPLPLFPETRALKALARPQIGSSSSDPPSSPSTIENGPKAVRGPQKSFASDPHSVPTSSLSNTNLLTAGDTGLDPESSVSNELANAVMRDNNGLLQQFLEYTVGPMITSSIAQLQDERSWEEASQSSFRKVPVSERLLMCTREIANISVKQEIFREMEGQCLEPELNAKG